MQPRRPIERATSEPAMTLCAAKPRPGCPLIRGPELPRAVQNTTQSQGRPHEPIILGESRTCMSLRARRGAWWVGLLTRTLTAYREANNTAASAHGLSFPYLCFLPVNLTRPSCKASVTHRCHDATAAPGAPPRSAVGCGLGSETAASNHVTRPQPMIPRSTRLTCGCGERSERDPIAA